MRAGKREIRYGQRKRNSFRTVRRRSTNAFATKLLRYNYATDAGDGLFESTVERRFAPLSHSRRFAASRGQAEIKARARDSRSERRHPEGDAVSAE